MVNVSQLHLLENSNILVPESFSYDRQEVLITYFYLRNLTISLLQPPHLF